MSKQNLLLCDVDDCLGDRAERSPFCAAHTPKPKVITPQRQARLDARAEQFRATIAEVDPNDSATGLGVPHRNKRNPQYGRRR